MDGDAESLTDLAALYPAEGWAWVHAKELTIVQAVLLSLDIEPSTIAELAGERGEDELLHFGRCDDEFNSRLGQVMLALQTTALTPVDRGDTPIRISAPIFVAWAKTRGWTLPQWMADGQMIDNAVPPNTVGNAALRAAVVAYAKIPSNWVNPDTKLRRTQGELAHEFLNNRCGSPIDYHRLGCSSRPASASIQNILSANKTEWQETARPRPSIQRRRIV